MFVGEQDKSSLRPVVLSNSKVQLSTGYVADSTERVHDVQHYASEYLETASSGCFSSATD
jgi:hypothetical protein